MRMKVVMTMTDNPWTTIKTPDYASISLRKVPDVDFDDGVSVSWSKTYDNRVGLYIEYPQNSVDEVLPDLKAVQIQKGSNPRNRSKFISATLFDSEIIEPFYKLCAELIDAVELASAESVCRYVNARLSKWQYLLRGRGRQLGLNEQKGLIAELIFLYDYAMKAHTALDAVTSWTGPLKTPRDFTFGETFVEVKSNQGSQNPRIEISSEFQLNSDDHELLYLFVVSLSETNGTLGKTLDDYVDRVRKRLKDDYFALEEYEKRLAAVGYRAPDKYDDHRWKEMGTVSYWVIDDFPRIQSGKVPTGISHVKYEIDLDQCGDYAVSPDVICAAIGV